MKISFLGQCLIFSLGILQLMHCAKDKAEQPQPVVIKSFYLIDFLKGQVEFALVPAGPWHTLNKEDTIFQDQCVRTGRESGVLLKSPQNDKILLLELSRLILNPQYLKKYAKEDPKSRGVKLLNGKSWLDVNSNYGKFLAGTPDGVATVRGTQFSLHYSAEKRKTRIVLKEGSLSVQSNNTPEKETILKPGESLEFQYNEPPRKTQVNPDELNMPDLSQTQAIPSDQTEAGVMSPPDSPLEKPDYQKVEKKLSKIARQNQQPTGKTTKALNSHKTKVKETITEHKKAVEKVIEKHEEGKKDAYDKVEKEKAGK
jgi:hypothetical protein